MKPVVDGAGAEVEDRHAKTLDQHPRVGLRADRHRRRPWPSTLRVMSGLTSYVRRGWSRPEAPSRRPSCRR